MIAGFGRRPAAREPQGGGPQIRFLPAQAASTHVPPAQAAPTQAPPALGPPVLVPPALVPPALVPPVLIPLADASPADVRQAHDFIRECVETGTVRQALLVRVSQLPPGTVRPHHARLAGAALDPLAVADRARIFGFANGDVLVAWRGDAGEVLACAVAELRTLFAGIAREPGSVPGSMPGSMIVAFALPDDAAELARLIAVAPEPAAAGPPLPVLPLDLASLATLEAALAQADVTRFARRKAVRGKGGPAAAVVWEKRYLSVAEIMGTLLPGRTAQADPWLFRRLTRTLDRRMLALLSLPGELRGAGPFSLNLNVGGVLSPEFLRFDAALPTSLRGHVVLELQPADVISDLPAFCFARDFARARGYRLLLRGLGPDLLRMVAPGAMGADMVQLRWEPGFAAVDLAALAIDPGRAVLARGTTADAQAWAARQGIGLFQHPRSGHRLPPPHRHPAA